MSTRHINMAVIVLLTSLVLAACTLPAPTRKAETENPSAAFTAAAQTIVARLTQASITPAIPSTPLPTGAELPTATQLAPATQATETSTPEPSPTAEATAQATEEATAQATETAAPTETQQANLTATPTLPASDPKAALGTPDFVDTFQNADNWAIYEDKHVSFKVDQANGELVMTAFNPDSWDGWMLSWPVLSDFYLEMTATSGDCSGLDRYGLVFRSVKSDTDYVGYLFGITCDGRYSLRRWNGEKFIPIIDWTADEHIRSGLNQTNRIGVYAQGDRISLYANSELLEEVRDSTHEEGKFGVFVGSVNTSDFIVRVDEIDYWELP